MTISIPSASTQERSPRLRPANLLLLALALVPACGREGQRSGAQDPGPADTAAWTVAAEPRVRIGAENGAPEETFEGVYGALAATGGRIVVGNSGTGELRFFDPNGRFLFASGRQGSGPGEFRAISWVGQARGDSILVYDLRLRRFSVLDADGRFGRSYDLPPPAGSSRPVGILADGALLLAAEEPYDPRGVTGTVRDHLLLLRSTPTGEVTDTVARVRGAEWLVFDRSSSFSATRLPFGRSGHVAVAGENAVYASSDSPELSFYDRSGSLVRKVAMEAEPRSLTKAEVSGYLDSFVRDPAEQAAIRGYMDGDAGRRTAPLISALRASRDGNVWVQLFPPAGGDTAKWVVVSPGGARVGSVRLAATDLPLDVRPGAILVRERDADGVESVTLRALSR